MILIISSGDPRNKCRNSFEFRCEIDDYLTKQVRCELADFRCHANVNIATGVDFVLFFQDGHFLVFLKLFS